MNGPFKLKGWSPFTQTTDNKESTTDNKESDITGSKSISSKRTNTLIKKHQGSASVDNPPPYIYGRGNQGREYRLWRRQFVKGLKDK